MMSDVPDKDFDWYISCLPASYWARYDLAAVQLGWEAHKAFIKANPKPTSQEVLDRNPGVCSNGIPSGAVPHTIGANNGNII